MKDTVRGGVQVGEAGRYGVDVRGRGEKGQVKGGRRSRSCRWEGKSWVMEGRQHCL